ncbi:MAG: sugar phosphate isomerase/epimerase family protein [Phycisphaerae bacterium]
MAKPVIGAQLFTCRGYCKDIDGVASTLKKIADIGYTHVQISGFGPVDPKDVAKALQDAGLKCSCTHMGWKRFKEDLDGVIEDHKTWDCVHTAIGSLGGGDYFSPDGVKRFAEELAPIAEKLAAEGMDFSFHNHNQELQKMPDGRTWLQTLYQDIPGDVLKAEIDTYWIVAGGGDPVQYIDMCAGREPLVHFKDMVITADREIRMAEIGEGNLNWSAIIDACDKCGVEYALVEQDQTYDRDPFEALEISYRNLTGMGLK